MPKYMISFSLILFFIFSRILIIKKACIIVISAQNWPTNSIQLLLGLFLGFQHLPFYNSLKCNGFFKVSADSKVEFTGISFYIIIINPLSEFVSAFVCLFTDFSKTANSNKAHYQGEFSLEYRWF